MKSQRIFNGAVCIVAGIVMAWNACRLAAMAGRGGEWSGTAMWVAGALALVMVLTGITFVHRGLR